MVIETMVSHATGHYTPVNIILSRHCRHRQVNMLRDSCRIGLMASVRENKKRVHTRDVDVTFVGYGAADGSINTVNTIDAIGIVNGDIGRCWSYVNSHWRMRLWIHVRYCWH